jgi:uncharacterized protein YrzB (UPF0473 family)
MWRIINVWLLFCCLASSVWAQRITGAEYFFNHDPGVGAGITASVQGDGKVRLEASIEVGSVPEGFNSLFFRFKNDLGIWSLAEGRMLYIEKIPVPVAKDIVAAEYFFDHDPGVGQGYATNVGPDGTLVGQIAVDGLVEGFHQLFFRFKDNFGFWSLAEGRQVYVEKIPIPASRTTVKAEYFFDSDPGIGNGLSIPVDPSGVVQGEVETAGIETGFHQLFMRVQDNTGQWSIAEGRMFFIEKLPILADRNIVQAEYFFDNDPGIGNGLAIAVDPSGTIQGEVETAEMEEGFHQLYMRVQDNTGQWSLAEGRMFFIEKLPVLADRNIAKAEYFFDKDPGIGKAFEIIPGADGSIIKNFDSNGMTEGFHKLFVRYQDDLGSWGHAEGRSFLVYDFQDVSLALDELGKIILQPQHILISGATEFPYGTLSFDKNQFDCMDIGENTVKVTITDPHGEVVETEVKVAVYDDLAPVIKTREIVLALGADGTARISASDVDAGTMDNCGIAELEISRSEFTCSDLGSQDIVFIARDESGNEFKNQVTVTIVDELNPMIKTKNIEVELDASGSASISPTDVDDGSFDNCGIKEMQLSQTTFTCSDLGQKQLTFTVVDNSGNESVREITVTVSDPILPIAKAKNIELALGADGTVTLDAASINDGSTDNCGIKAITVSKTSFTCSDIGDNSVVLRVTDHQGNEATAEAIVTVLDETSPVIKTKTDIHVKLDEDGVGVLTVEDIDDGSLDNCGIKEMRLSQTTFTCSDLGQKQLIFTVVDNSGNESFQEITVTVTDPILPIAKAKNIELALGADGTVTLDAASINDGSTDNCGINSITISKTSFTCSEIGENPVVLLVTDHQGNEATAEAIVTVLDETSPVIKTKTDIHVKLDEDGVGLLTVEDIDDGSTDNCGIVDRTLSKVEFDPGDAGEATLTYTVKDASGNTASKEIKVTVDVVLSSGPVEVDMGNPVKLYPNPTKNLINIAYERKIDDQLRVIEIVDVNGRIMRQVTEFDRNGDTITIDVGNYRAGTYMVRLFSNRNVQVLRFNLTK